MLLVDLILILAIVSFTVAGAKAGFVKTLGGLIGAILSFVAARYFSPWLAVPLMLVLPNHGGVAHFIAFILIFLLVDRLVNALVKFISVFTGVITNLPLIKSFNSLLGAIIGFAEGIVLIGSFVYLILSTHVNMTLIGWVSGSTVAQYTERVFSSVLGYLL